jgi:uncharacterized protein
LLLSTDELSDERFVTNPPERCYFCKTELFDKLTSLAKENGLSYVLDGSNADDVNDFRPGSKAAKEFGIRSPLREAGMTKDDIRAVSKAMGLPTWDKPSFACLSSRFPYGERITREKLDQIAGAETFLRSLGVRQLRVRHHGEIARIEVTEEVMDLVLAIGRRLPNSFAALVFVMSLSTFWATEPVV